MDEMTDAEVMEATADVPILLMRMKQRFNVIQDALYRAGRSAQSGDNWAGYLDNPASWENAYKAWRNKADG